MKKLFLSFTFLFWSLFLTMNSVLAANAIFFKNENDVSMTKAEYDKFISLGYTDNELSIMTRNQFDKINSINFISTQKKKIYSKSTYYNDELIQNNFIDTYLDLSRIKNDNFITVLSYDDYTKTYDEDKEMYLYASNYMENNFMNILFKANVNWLTTPSMRATELLTIVPDNYYRFKAVDTINGKKPEFESSFTYKEHYIKEYANSYDQDKNIDTINTRTRVVTNVDEMNFKYSFNEGLSVQYTLPHDFSTKNLHDYLGDDETFIYYDFQFTITTHFIAYQTTELSGGCINANYSHQYDSGNFNWDALSFSTQPPFISYRGKWWIDDPQFDDLYTTLILEY